MWINGDKEIDVAMKTLNKQVVRDEDQIKFLQEAAIMAQFRHPNIVTLYGITYKEEPVSFANRMVPNSTCFHLCLHIFLDDVGARTY